VIDYSSHWHVTARATTTAKCYLVVTTVTTADSVATISITTANVISK